MKRLFFSNFYGLITLCVVSLAFFIFPRVFYFSSRFFNFSSRFYFSNTSKLQDNDSILHYTLGTNANQLRFSHNFLAFLLTNFTKTQTQRIV